MVQPFTLEMPRAVVFGPGVRARLPELLRAHGRRVLLCTGSRWFAGSGRQQEFTSLLEGFEMLALAVPPGEPECEILEPLLARVRELRPEVILAVGGGSVLDTAKAISVLAPLGGRVEDFLEGVGKALPITAPGLPWIGVPTTAGTGAEATKNAVVRSRRLGYKRSLRSPFLLAAAAVVDPELSLGCPRELTGTAGLDALAQLVESFVCRKATDFPRALARQAFPLMLSALKTLASDPGNLSARSDAAFGALVSGITLANAGLGAAHGFASALGGMYDIPHGLICALFLPEVLAWNAQQIRADCALLLASVREREGGSFQAAEDPVAWLIGEVRTLSGLFGLPAKLEGFGIEAKDLPEIARRSSGSSMSGNPRELPLAERERMIARLL
jgi:alcohol dehydrogenase class IV